MRGFRSLCVMEGFPLKLESSFHREGCFWSAAARRSFGSGGDGKILVERIIFKAKRPKRCQATALQIAT